MLELHKFTCRKCGGNNLIYEKWIQSNEDVIIHENGHIEYCKAVIESDNDLGACDGYKCRDCRKYLIYYGSIISTERDLIAYLMLTPEERNDDEQAYQEMVQEQIEREEACGFKLL